MHQVTRSDRDASMKCLSTDAKSTSWLQNGDTYRTHFRVWVVLIVDDHAVAVKGWKQ
jgi:hypothetical protein